MTGCSMATPHVSGIAATLMEHYPDFRRPSASAARPPDGVDRPAPRRQTAPANNTSGGRNDFGLAGCRTTSRPLGPSQSERLEQPLGLAGRSPTAAGASATSRCPSGTDRLVVVMTWDEPAASAGAALRRHLRPRPVGRLRGRLHAGRPRPVRRVGLAVLCRQHRISDHQQPARRAYRLKMINWDAPSFGAAHCDRGQDHPRRPDARDEPGAAPSRARSSGRIDFYGHHQRVPEPPSYVSSGAHDSHGDLRRPQGFGEASSTHAAKMALR